MKKIITLVLVFVIVLGTVGCGKTQYYFSGKVIEVQNEYLRLEVIYRGNTKLFKHTIVEVSTNVVSAGGCPEFEVNEYARVVMARNTGYTATDRLDALSIYKTDETGKSIEDDLPSSPEPEAYAFEAQYIRTNGYSENRSYPYHVVINSREELEAYYEANKDIFDLERKEKVYSDTTIGFLDACDKYDDAYFERQNLVLIILEEGSGSVRHEITDVRRHRNEDGTSDGWDITIDRIVPEVGTDDMAEWHLFLEVQMGKVIKDRENVWINGKLSGASVVGQSGTKLEFGIAENVDNVDFSEYQERFGLMGGREYYGKGYIPTIDEDGQQVDPEECVIYTVTSYPDYSSRKQHITRISITDPSVEVYGLTLHSSNEDINTTMKKEGFKLKGYENSYGTTYTKGRITIHFTEECISINADVSNIFGIQF